MSTQLVSPDVAEANLATTFDQISAMIKLYRETRPEADVANSGWVSFNEIKALIKANKGNGVRFYYGRHLDTKQLSVILVATRDKVDPKNPTTQNSDDVLDKGHFVGIMNAPLPMGGNGDDSIPLCPPNCPGKSL